MKHLIKSIPMILMLVVFQNGSTSAQERDQIILPDVALAQRISIEDQFSIETLEETEVLEQPQSTETIYGSGLSYLKVKVHQGQAGSIVRSYQVTTDTNGEVISKVENEQLRQTIPAQAETYQQGATVQVGATFVNPYFTRYGADCAGCTIKADGSAATAAGIRLTTTSVRQGDGSWKEGITYNGRHIFATNSDIPMCTLITISDHQYSGAGITPGQPIYGIVGDRGVGPNHLDFFVGSEYNLSKVQPIAAQNPTVTITGFGTWTGNGCSF